MVIATSAFAQERSLVGSWEYRQENRGSPTGYDSEGEQLRFANEAGTIKGAYFGLEREGEHGLFYTAVEVTDLVVSLTKVRFTVPARLLFCKRPASLQDKAPLPDCGMTREPLVYEGELKGNVLRLKCSAAWGCPADELTFRRIQG
jgi:hypothetical protein